MKNNTDLVESLVILYGFEKSKPTANPGRRSTVMELASATPLDGYDYSNFPTAVRKLIFMAPWRPDMQFCCPTTIHTCPQSHDREQARSETVDAISQKIRSTPVFVLNPAKWFKKGLLELVGRRNSNWAGDSATRQCVTGYHCDVQNVTMCNRSLRQTAISLSSCEAEFYAASACAGELLGLTELFKKLHYNVSVRVEMDSDSARHILQRRGPGGLKQIDIRCFAIKQWTREKTSIGESNGHEEQHCRSLHETSGWIANAVARKESWTLNPGWY